MQCSKKLHLPLPIEPITCACWSRVISGRMIGTLSSFRPSTIAVRSRIGRTAGGRGALRASIPPILRLAPTLVGAVLCRFNQFVELRHEPLVSFGFSSVAFGRTLDRGLDQRSTHFLQLFQTTSSRSLRQRTSYAFNFAI